MSLLLLFQNRQSTTTSSGGLGLFISAYGVLTGACPLFIGEPDFLDYGPSHTRYVVRQKDRVGYITYGADNTIYASLASENIRWIVEENVNTRELGGNAGVRSVCEVLNNIRKVGQEIGDG